jgi:hypothetical protein
MTALRNLSPAAGMTGPLRRSSGVGKDERYPTPDGTKTRARARRSAPLMPDDRDGRGYPPIGGFFDPWHLLASGFGSTLTETKEF